MPKHSDPVTLESVIEQALTEHRPGERHRDARYHCACGWVSPQLVGVKRVEPDPEDPKPRTVMGHRAEAIAKAVRKFAVSP